MTDQFEASPSVIEVLMDDGSWRAAVALKPGDGEHDGWVLAQDGSGTNTLVWWCAPGEWRAVSMPDQPVGHSDPSPQTPQAESRSSLRMRAALDGECPICFHKDLSAALWECLLLSGADVSDYANETRTADGKEHGFREWVRRGSAREVVAAVRELRDDYDEACGEVARWQAKAQGGF